MKSSICCGVDPHTVHDALLLYELGCWFEGALVCALTKIGKKNIIPVRNKNFVYLLVLNIRICIDKAYLVFKYKALYWLDK